MGVPLARVPDPAGDCHPSYARHFAQVFIDTFDGLGIRPDTYYWMSEIYGSGAMDRYIRTALDAAATIREIYVRVANVRPSRRLAPALRDLRELRTHRHDDRHRLGRRAGPLRVPCRPRDVGDRLREPAARSRRSADGRSCPITSTGPRSGTSSASRSSRPGKDLSTAGGSRDRSDAIAREVFGNEPPRNVPYEFLNIGGRKMSTSKGLGASAQRIAEVIPPEQLRLLFLRPRPNTAIEFDPDGTDAIPRLFDESDRLAAATAGREVRGELPPGPRARLRHQPGRARCGRCRRGGLRLSARVQPPRAARADPGVDVAERVTAEKGSPLTERELDDPRGAPRCRPGLARRLRAGARPPDRAA